MNKMILRVTGAAIVGALAFQAASLDVLLRIGISVVIGLPAFVLIIVGRRQLGESFSVMPEAKSLVTTGLYSRLQHPMYVFLDLFLAAVIVALGMTILLWLWGAVVIVQVLQARREENVLRSAFGTDYEAYAKQLWL